MAKNSSQAAIFRDQAKSAVQSLIGWLLAVIFGIVSVYGCTQIEKSSDVIGLILCFAITAAGILMIIKSRKRKN